MEYPLFYDLFTKSLLHSDNPKEKLPDFVERSISDLAVGVYERHNSDLLDERYVIKLAQTCAESMIKAIEIRMHTISQIEGFVGGLEALSRYGALHLMEERKLDQAS